MTEATDTVQATSPVVPAGTMLATRIEQFILCREKRRLLKKEFEDKDKPLSLLENKLSGAIMLLLGDLDSAACPAGTAFKTTKTTASLTDPDAFMKHVIETGQFDLLDRKANTTAVKDYVKLNNCLPPGANLSSRMTIGVHKKVGGGADQPAQEDTTTGDQTS